MDNNYYLRNYIIINVLSDSKLRELHGILAEKLLEKVKNPECKKDLFLWLKRKKKVQE